MFSDPRFCLPPCDERTAEQILSWLGLPSDGVLPNFYTLLGISPDNFKGVAVDERGLEIIAKLRAFQLSHPEAATVGMVWIAKALDCLTDPVERQKYDAALAVQSPQKLCSLLPRESFNQQSHDDTSSIQIDLAPPKPDQKWWQDLPPQDSLILPDTCRRFVNSIGMTFVRIPPGLFHMGSPVDEPERGDDEEQHWVMISRGFFLGMHLVTQRHWQQIMDKNPSQFVGPALPVENVSWNDAQEFCVRISAITGSMYRLPTEAEWEYACRAGTTTPFSFGTHVTTNLLNYDGRYRYGRGERGKSPNRTTPAGSFPPNLWGLFDMHGNVWEWCEDGYGPYILGTSQRHPETDPLAPHTSTTRVVRGGSWRFPPRSCRSAYRDPNEVDYRSGDLGFRVVLVPEIS